MEMDKDNQGHGRVSAHRGTKLDIFARETWEGQILPGGRILFFPHGICKILKSKSVI